jgi:hypothetical protein
MNSRLPKRQPGEPSGGSKLKSGLPGNFEEQRRNLRAAMKKQTLRRLGK